MVWAAMQLLDQSKFEHDHHGREARRRDEAGYRSPRAGDALVAGDDRQSQGVAGELEDMCQNHATYQVDLRRIVDQLPLCSTIFARNANQEAGCVVHAGAWAG